MLDRISHAIVLTGALVFSADPAAAQDDADDVTVRELNARVAELEATVHRLQAEAGNDWLTERRAEEIRALVHDVLADADTRSNLQDSGLNAGWDGKFFLASADGNFRLNVSGQLQVRFVYNHQENSPDDDDRWGFENRRTKLTFDGHIIDPSWQFEVKGGFEADGGSFVLEDAVVTKVVNDHWLFRFGQFKPPFMRERLVSSSRQLAIQRSLVNAEFGQRRAQGIEAGYAGERVAAKIMYNEGFGTRNTPALERDTEFAATGRLELLAAGTWSQFNDFSSWVDEEFAALFGVAANYEQEEYGTDDSETETFAATADVSLEFGGANLFGAVVYRSLDENAGGPDADQWGFVIQGGIFVVPDTWEIFVRYEYSDLDEPGVEDLSVITVGATRYIASHTLKWTTDIGFGVNELAGAFASSGAGWREDAPGEDSQVVLRTQLQLIF